jgi:hypothetical protein
MATPIWRKIVSQLVVPEAGQQWTVALEALTVGKMMKVEVVVDPGATPPIPGTWTPKGYTNPCTADGYFDSEALPPGGNPAPTPLLAGTPPGALIARIGGSTADQTIDAAEKPKRIVFSIGRRCVFTVPDAPTGSLFLGVNDAAARMAAVAGSLKVNIYEAV